MPTDALTVELAQERPIPLDVVLDCAPGELLALVGPSGSGKSTILRTIAGIYTPARGRIDAGGETWLDTASGIQRPARERSVGFVFQHYALFPHLTALENVLQAMGHVAPAARETRARQLLERTNLGGLEARRPAQLSGGQQQRVAVARALARDPKVLLLDEPFSAVDQVTRRRLQRELAQMRQRLRIPIVLVTHDLEEAAALADRMVVLHRGTTLQDGPPLEVLARPKNALVARLMDFRNLFHGEVVAHDAAAGTTLLRWEGHDLEATHRPEHAIGSRVCWGIQPAHCVLHRRDRPSRGERENPVAGEIVRCVPMGEMTAVALRVVRGERTDLVFSVPTHVAARNGLVLGETASVSLLTAGIHLMAPSP